jgi:hypothetical protein
MPNRTVVSLVATRGDVPATATTLPTLSTGYPSLEFLNKNQSLEGFGGETANQGERKHVSPGPV